LPVESLVFIGVHVKYSEVTPLILSGVLGLVLAFVAYGRMVLNPIFRPDATDPILRSSPH
jgi:hypothetical protein